MDGDSRGGAALSMKSVSGRPVKFISTGERLEQLEAFYPDRVASRILGKPLITYMLISTTPLKLTTRGARFRLATPSEPASQLHVQLLCRLSPCKKWCKCLAKPAYMF